MRVILTQMLSMFRNALARLWQWIFSHVRDRCNLAWLVTYRWKNRFLHNKIAHKALCVTSFPSYLKLSFKKLSRYLRNKDEFLINNYYKNNNTFIGKARILFNNLPYQIRSISSFESFSRKVKKHLFDQAQAKYFQRH